MKQKNLHTQVAGRHNLGTLFLCAANFLSTHNFVRKLDIVPRVTSQDLDGTDRCSTDHLLENEHISVFVSQPTMVAAVSDHDCADSSDDYNNK